MGLPRGDEYNQAIQSPNLNFLDLELKECQVETTPLGLPKPYSGGFTTTYKLKSASQDWAVRCFTREIRDLQERYSSISTFQNKNQCSFLVDAKYLKQGIRVNGAYFPVIKMNWLNGEPLNLFLESNYNKKSAVENLLQKFLELNQQLETYGIAHGDLQHGNILVKGGELFLIDYDGMFLPDIANLTVNELGHPNFQHPRRSSNDYDNQIDHFSACIIYTALKAISISPALWKKYNNGDNLLFKAQDFLNPLSSPIFNDLKNINGLQKFSNNLAAVCSLEFSKIPPLERFIKEKIAFSTKKLPTLTSVRNAYSVLDGTLKGHLLEHVGEKVEVIGKLSSSKNGKTIFGDPYVLLNIGQFPNQTFTVAIWSEGLKTINKYGISIDDLYNNWISITGVITTYGGKPQMTLETPSQIKILKNKNEADSRLNYSSNYSKTSVTNQVNAKTKNKKLETTLKEIEVFNNLYRNKPAQYNSSKLIQPNKSIKKTYNNPPTSSTSKSDNTGCILPIVFGIIGALVVGGLSESAGGAMVGLIGGGFLGSLFSGN